MELALTLPLLALLALALLQVGLVVRDQVALTHATREAVREGVVTADPAAPRRAALAGAGLDPDRLLVEVGPRGRSGSRLRVTLRYASPTDVPLIGPLLGEVQLSATAAMRVES